MKLYVWQVKLFKTEYPKYLFQEDNYLIFVFKI